MPRLSNAQYNRLQRYLRGRLRTGRHVHAYRQRRNGINWQNIRNAALAVAAVPLAAEQVVTSYDRLKKRWNKFKRSSGEMIQDFAGRSQVRATHGDQIQYQPREPMHQPPAEPTRRYHKSKKRYGKAYY